jgi:hypothetical protein
MLLILLLIKLLIQTLIKAQLNKLIQIVLAISSVMFHQMLINKWMQSQVLTTPLTANMDMIKV